ncbi:hypothetical protein A2Z33_03425 [Candidatus Gottesmanbacteria bacterium RBG_16_52_11]|uniref:Phosphoribosyltransferase domain-containing protein n=1 Tax=Candidatus Gottesmanbacteria bacterium RBG_16_52_11 TaxID=1798374 RepID=A0A1F5YVE5_9BACT|nr:MAG: hypothetical protein A2Z33_03425 [Candidatus Gottesmanbacteria bacterium RBG_16_52_11]
MLFEDRIDAGKQLARALPPDLPKPDIIYGLARGGAVIAAEISRITGYPLDVLVVKKVPSPLESELAIGAVAPDNVVFIDERLTGYVSASREYIRGAVRRLSSEVRSRMKSYHTSRPLRSPEGRHVLLSDDGIATGATFSAAVMWLKSRKASRITAALPVAPSGFLPELRKLTDTQVVLVTPDEFGAVGQFYRDFRQVPDAAVIELLRKGGKVP